MTRLFFFVSLCICLAGQVCALVPSAKKSDVLFRVRNIKYHLVCVFHGELIRLDDHFAEDIKYVSVTDERSGKHVRFRPINGAALEDSRSFYKDVWSPDMEWLVLPLGTFNGFQIIKARDAIAELQKKGQAEFVRIEMETGAGLVHEFNGWKNPHSFNFTVGLSGDHWQYTVDVTNLLSIRPLEKGGGDVMFTSKGRSITPHF